MLTGFELGFEPHPQGRRSTGHRRHGDRQHHLVGRHRGGHRPARALQEMVGRGTGIDDAGIRPQARGHPAGHGPQPAGPARRPGRAGQGRAVSRSAASPGSCWPAPTTASRSSIDGFISTAGALIAHCLCPRAADYMFAGHRSEEPGHRHMLRASRSWRRSSTSECAWAKGTGAALAMNVIEAAVRVMTEVMTFA
ncbi:MAG: nicotinate-nucleotide--dimethylbenzimidazole phosphoribosyltransferase [Desulfobacterales bacterium]|nr:nicotinate-nucleotide--dimethylbenzimidazole phosphoribosyltransferase [Desulfobacterales bacterium]